MSLLNRDPSLVDISRAIAEVRYEMASEGAADHIELLHFIYRSIEPYLRLEAQLSRRAAKIALRHSVQPTKFGVSVMKTEFVNPESVPLVFKDDALKQGFALGLHIHRKVYGGDGSNADLADYVDVVTGSDSVDPQHYATILEKAGSKAYDGNLSSPRASAIGLDDPLRKFVKEISSEVFEDTDIDRIVQFQVGIGLTRAAFNYMSEDIDMQLRGIEAVTALL